MFAPFYFKICLYTHAKLIKPESFACNYVLHNKKDIDRRNYNCKLPFLLPGKLKVLIAVKALT